MCVALSNRAEVHYMKMSLRLSGISVEHGFESYNKLM